MAKIDHKPRSRWLGLERRLRRSESRDQALQFLLERSLNNAGLDAIVLANADGLAISESGCSETSLELAAYAPLISHFRDRVALSPALADLDIGFVPIHIHQNELYLAYCGGGAAREALIHNVADGIRRILLCN